jgi:WD40 repeat protein
MLAPTRLAALVCALAISAVSGLARADALVLVATLDHKDFVLDVRLSTDTTRVVTASLDGTAKIWDAKSGKLLFTLRGHSGAVHTAEISGDGTQVVTAGDDGTAKIWDARSGKLVRTLKGHKATRPECTRPRSAATALASSQLAPTKPPRSGTRSLASRYSRWPSTGRTSAWRCSARTTAW